MFVCFSAVWLLVNCSQLICPKSCSRKAKTPKANASRNMCRKVLSIFKYYLKKNPQSNRAYTKKMQSKVSDHQRWWRTFKKYCIFIRCLKCVHVYYIVNPDYLSRVLNTETYKPLFKMTSVVFTSKKILTYLCIHVIRRVY